jgi:N-acetylmuramoyl-L-alanine amidase
MRLSRIGKVTVESLRVRQRPQLSAPVIEQLTSGQEVKVTEKRVQNENIWFRVITPAGKAGWVDFRFLKLEGNA